jgi:long-chain acyl-CoA synthetase
MLTHKNLWWTADAALKITNVNENDCTLSYLPLAHIAEQMFTIHVPVSAGYPVYFAEGMTPEILAGNLGEVQPTVFFGVPRIWEKFHTKLAAGLGAATGIKAILASWAMGVGRDVSALKMRGETPAGLLAIKHRLADKLIFSKVKPKIGLSRAKICVSGAAPIAPEVLEFFTGLDIVVQEVYGQSEDTGPTSFNLTGRTRFGTVGPAVEGCEVVIAEDDEILVRGPNVFKGYYKDEAATAEALVDGWLHSGDLGSFDSDGFLSITGRKKDIIITAGGKNIAPKKVEAALKNIIPINEAVMVGDKRKFCSAVVTIDPDWAADYAKKEGTDFATLHEYAPLRAMLEAEVNKANQEFPSVMQIKKFAILPRNFTIEDKELTPTLKVKRRFVYENWDAEIEALYS